MQLGKTNDPASRDAVQIRHVYVHLVHVTRRENRLWLRSGRKRGKIRRAGPVRQILDGGIGVRPLRRGNRFRKAEIPAVAEPRNTGLGPRISTADAYPDIAS